MADLDPDTIPSIMPAEQAIAKADGKPTTPMLDFLSALRTWTKTQAVDLRTKITSVIDQVGDAMAAISLEQNARATADEALAEQINTVEASVGSATANGEIYFAAKAAPSGAAAAYGIYLTAGNYYGGLEIIATSGGGAAIGFAANRFTFVDSGTAQTILSYSGGYYTFNANVKINGALVVDGSITVNGITSGAIGFGGAASQGTLNLPNSDGDTSWYDYATATLSPKKDGRALFLFSYYGSASSRYTDGTRTLQFRIVRRKSGGDTVVFGPVQFNTVGFNYFRWFFDQPGAGEVSYVCQHAFVSQTGSSSGGTYISRSDSFRIDWTGTDS